MEIAKNKPLYDTSKKTDFIAYFDHLTTEDYKDAYEPSEDTFLLIDTLYYDEKFICENVQPENCLEIGIGCGFVITGLCNLLYKKFPSCKFLGIDINPNAINISQKTVKRYNFESQIALKNCDISKLSDQKFDIIVFNPVFFPM